MVVTSRIHAALPCLGMETPVVFIANPEVLAERGTFNTPGRLGGLVELFRILNLEDGTFFTDDEVLRGIEMFTWESSFKHKDDWKPYAERLDKQLSAFMSGDFDDPQIESVRNIPAVK